MFDYTCSHCQKTHHAIHGAMERYGDDLAVIALPVPLNAACNNTVTATHAKHIEACELARLAMAVWRLNSPQFPIFHDWLFEPSGGRRAAEARVFAAQLVGEEALRNELASGIPDKFLATHVTLFTRAGKGQIPKLLFPRTTLVGEVGSTDTVCNTIERELGGR
jgi:hypothetical protein